MSAKHDKAENLAPQIAEDRKQLDAMFPVASPLPEIPGTEKRHSPWCTRNIPFSRCNCDDAPTTACGECVACKDSEGMFCERLTPPPRSSESVAPLNVHDVEALQSRADDCVVMGRMEDARRFRRIAEFVDSALPGGTHVLVERAALTQVREDLEEAQDQVGAPTTRLIRNSIRNIEHWLPHP